MRVEKKRKDLETAQEMEWAGEKENWLERKKTSGKQRKGTLCEKSRRR